MKNDSGNNSITLGFVIVLLLNGLVLPISAAGQADQDSGTFTLVLYGEHLAPHAIQISLKENPGLKNRWVRLGKLSRAQMVYTGADSNKVFIARGLPKDRFVGQDIRENYIEFRIVPLRDAERKQVALRGAWAFHSLHKRQGNNGSSLLNRIQEDPIELNEQSFASLVYPRDKKVIPGHPLIDHIELPVRPYKPGVREVQWLQLLFSR